MESSTVNPAGNLPPGCRDGDFERARNRPLKLRCIDCGLDFPQEMLDEDEICSECVRDRVNEDGEVDK